MLLQTSPPVKIVLFIDAGRGRNWHRALGDALLARGHDVGFEAQPLKDRRSQQYALQIDQLLGVERRLYDIPADHAFGGFCPPTTPSATPTDLTIDLSSAGCGASACLFPMFNGLRGEAGLFGALTNTQAPRLTIMAADLDHPVLVGHPAIENREIASFGLANLAMAAVALLLKAVDQIGTSPSEQLSADLPQPQLAPSPLVYGFRNLGTKIIRNLRRKRPKFPEWHVAWRRINGDAMQDTGLWPHKPFTTLPDDGQRYFADPFILMQDGMAHVFCEEFPHTTGKGIISHFTLDQQGGASPVRPVLECPYHLSYPQVFAFGEAIYMLPETAANRRLEIYRARRFPDDWVLEKVLIDPIDAGDATFIVHAGRCWLFCTTRQPHGSSWDQLAIFHAPHPLGPWTAHQNNPVILDASCARPGGAMWVKDGMLHRVAQDCAADYGGALQLLRVEQLDDICFRQTRVAHITPPCSSRWKGLHTLNAAGGFEIIDYLC